MRSPFGWRRRRNKPSRTTTPQPRLVLEELESRLVPSVDVLTEGVRPQPVTLSQLIDLVNERFGTDFNQADQLFFDQIVAAAMADDGLRQAAAVNPGDKFELVFDCNS